MACDLITQGRAKQCKSNIGGQSHLYLFNYVEDPFTIVAGEATAINAAITEVFDYVLEGDGNTLVEDMVADENTGVSINTQTITAVLRKQTAADSAELNLLSYSNAQAVVRDRNGVYHACGISDGFNWNVNAATGGAKTEFNGYTVTGVATEGMLSPKLDSATITAWLALV